MSTTQTLVTVLLGALSFILIVALIWYILTVIAFWKIFSKAGRPGWMSIIPLVNMHVLFGIAWKSYMFWITVGLAFVSAFAQGMSEGALGTIVAGICTLATMAITIIFNLRLAKAFGKSSGFGIGLWLLNTIFILILGLGSSQYVGNPDDGSII